MLRQAGTGAGPVPGTCRGSAALFVYQQPRPQEVRRDVKPLPEPEVYLVLISSPKKNDSSVQQFDENVEVP